MWHRAVLARARRVDSVLGDRLRDLGAVPVEALRAECEQAGVEESRGRLRLWRRRQAIALHLEVEFGEDLRAALAAGRYRGRVWQAVVDQLGQRCEVARSEVEAWLAEFGQSVAARREPGGAVAGGGHVGGRCWRCSGRGRAGAGGG
eukprot:11801906-Alexandrium_andersonii.AAC.1